MPDIVFEPTAGKGAFLLGAAKEFPRATLRGWDINQAYVDTAIHDLKVAGASSRADVVCQNFFLCDWEAELAAIQGSLLFLGNPPWVTNAGLAAINGSNLPMKENFQGLRGLAARTGKANFDISEWMLIRLLHALQGRPATFALLCKTGTARKFLRYAWQNQGQVTTAAIYRIDAARYFDAAVDACLLFLRTGAIGPEEADVYSCLSASVATSRIGLAGNEMVADIKGYRALQHLEGSCAFRWRSGVKHDCAAVMELHLTENGIENNAGEQIEMEEEYLFPFLKCSDLANGRISPKRLVLVTQHFVGDDTAVIATRAPQTWRYLQTHRERFHARKSSIYKGQAPFALFGIGDYAFAPWKVAVSGLHSSGHFQLIPPTGNKPVFFDDACYYLSFEHEEVARLVADILNSDVCKRFLQALVFKDAKRPITVDLLQRLNLSAIAAEAGMIERWNRFQARHHTVSSSVPQMEFIMEPVPAVP